MTQSARRYLCSRGSFRTSFDADQAGDEKLRNYRRCLSEGGRTDVGIDQRPMTRERVATEKESLSAEAVEARWSTVGCQRCMAMRSELVDFGRIEENQREVVTLCCAVDWTRGLPLARTVRVIVGLPSEQSNSLLSSTTPTQQHGNRQTKERIFEEATAIY